MKTLKELFSSLHRSPPLGNRNRPRIVILISSKGSNMRAILQKIREGKLLANCTLVLSDREAKGLAVAKSFGVAAELFAKRKEESREQFDARLVTRLKIEKPTLIICAGYMKILTKPMLAAFPKRILNIHPSLLPAFPGLKAQKQALDYGVKFSGCTIHLVDAGVDTGKILSQAVVAVKPKDDEESLSRRILKAEHETYWLAIARYLRLMSVG